MHCALLEPRHMARSAPLGMLRAVARNGRTLYSITGTGICLYYSCTGTGTGRYVGMPIPTGTTAVASYTYRIIPTIRP